jgi:hypothetical protein
MADTSAIGVRVGGFPNRDLHYYIVNKRVEMSREVEKRFCDYCESEYKIMYDLNETNGRTKFCPFCGSDVFDNEMSEEDEDE